MKLSRVLALSAALAATCASATATASTTNNNNDNNDDGGLLSFLSSELQHTSSLVQRLFYNADDTASPETVQLIIIEDDSEDAPLSALAPQQELTRQEQQLACETALQIFREKDALHEDRQRLSQRLRSPFKRAFQAMSLHYFDEASCDDLDDSRLVDGCNRFVDMEDAVRQFMARGRTNEQVCARVITHMDPESPASPDAMEGELSCKLCKRFVQMIDDALAQEVSQVQVVREIIGDICDSMAPDSRCHTFLDQYDQIVAWLKQGMSPDVVCTRTTMCTVPKAILDTHVSHTVASVGASTSALAASSDNGHACGYCAHITYVVIKVNAVSPEHLNFVRKLIEWGCKLSPRDCKCDVLVSKYDKIVAWVKQGKSPREICEALKVCTKASTAQVFALGGPDQSVGGALAALMPLVHVADSAADAAVQDTKTCFYCDYATTLIQIAMQEQGDVIDEVRMYADLICNLLGPDNMCHQYVDKLDAVIDALKQGKRPREICSSMKYCVAKSSVNVVDAATQTHAVAPFASSGALTRDDKTCMYCDYGALVLKIIMQQDAAQVDEIRQAADMVCGFMGPDNVCHQYVDKLDVMIDQLKQGKNPRVICVALKYCSATSKALAAPVESAMDAFVAQSQAVDVRDDKKCFYCDYVATLLQIVMQEDASQVDELREYADMICGILGPDNVCHQYVDKLDIVIDQLKKGQHPRQICVSLKYCTAKAESVMLELSDLSAITRTHVSHTVASVGASTSALAASSDNGHACGYCAHITYVVIKVNAVSPEHLNFVRKLIEWGCKLSPRDCKCDVLVSKYDKIVAWVKQGKSPREICEALKVCTKASTAQVFALGGPDQSVGGALAALMPLVHVADSAADAAVQDTKTCFYCDYATTLIQIAMQEQGDVIDEVRMYADLICNLLGPDNMCHQYVDKLDAVIDALKQGKRPREICSSMKYCVAKSSVKALQSRDIVDLSAFDQNLVKIVTNSIELAIDSCFMCTQLASILEVALQQDPSQIDQIRQIGDMVCHMLPSESKCRPVMDELDTVIDSLKKGETPKAICHDLKFCKASRTNAIVTASPVAVSQSANTSCAYCSGVVTVLEVALQQKPAEVKEAREAAGIVCGLLPSDDKCHDDLKLFDAAVKQLKSGKQPHEICTSLKFCDSEDAATAVTLADLAVVDPSLSPSRCMICKQNSLLLASMVGKPSRLAAFHDEMNTICRLIPDTKECELLLKHHDTIVDALARNEDVATICTRIRECGAATEPAQSVETASFSVSCLLCDYTAEMVKHAAKNQNELRLAKVALETMCTILPPTARCDEIASKFDELVEMAQRGKSPNAACRAIALCGGATAAEPVVATRADYLLPAAFVPVAPIGNIAEVE